METVKKVAEHYGVSKTTINNWIKKSGIKTERRLKGAKPVILLSITDMDNYLLSKGISIDES